MSGSPRVLFVGGLHRSGTTPLTRWISEHQGVSAFSDTNAPEDEGQHLQDVYATAAAHGGPGRFALAPGAHLTEGSSLVSEESRRRIWSSWAPHWDLSKPVVVEKSPPNLVRTRFLQALFPDRAYFLMVVRHPIAVAYATKRWTRRYRWIPAPATRRVGALQADVHSLIRHWSAAHRTFLADAPHLDNVLLVRYEDLIASPGGQLATVMRFVGLEPEPANWEVRTALNERYVERWRRHSSTPVGRAYLRRVEAELEPEVRSFGYSLARPSELGSPEPPVAAYMKTP